MTGLLARLPPAWLGYRCVARQTVAEYFSRHAGEADAGRYETIHPAITAANPLPCNVRHRNELPDIRGWWGFSFRDVPRRRSEETFIATIPDCRVVWYRDPTRSNDFYPAVLAGDGRALDMREMRFRPGHAKVLRRSGRTHRRDKATWIVERSYENHSHWLTAHVPKLLLLRERRALGHVLLPPRRTPAMEASLRLLDLDPASFEAFDDTRTLEVGELTVIGSDRFRPELLRMTAQAFAAPAPGPPHRRIFVSRAQAARRRLVNEDDLWPALAAAGFERVQMEALAFEDQVRVMRETAVLLGPHGAGLTNMLFCPPGAQVVELADLGFPNPNFYALASALGHRYWLVAAEGLGDGHPLAKDLRVDAAAVDRVLDALTRPEIQR